jgi:hypothetical protein
VFEYSKRGRISGHCTIGTWNIEDGRWLYEHTKQKLLIWDILAGKESGGLGHKS